LAKKEHTSTCFSEVVVDDLYYASLLYNKSSQNLIIEFDYIVREEKVNELNEIYIGLFKAANESIRKGKKLKLQRSNAEKRKLSSAEFIDNSNKLPIFRENDTFEEVIHANPKRRRTKAWKLDERQYEVKEILKSQFCYKTGLLKYHTLWSNNEKTWETKESFVDFDEEESEVVCAAFIKFENAQLL